MARRIRVFLSLEAGVARGALPWPESPSAGAGRTIPEARGPRVQELGQARRELARARADNRELRARLAATGDHTEVDLDPEGIIWIFGAARTGSTWLGSMMGDLTGCNVWQEPLVGDLFGHLYYVRGAPHIDRRGEDFILGRPHRESWIGSIRMFVLREAAVRFPEIAEGGYLVVKEPNGSLGAPLLMEALPESRMIFLVRDFRDVVASLLDANRENSWLQGWKGRGGRMQDTLADSAADAQPDSFVEARAKSLLRLMGNVKDAYDAHAGHKVLVKYEDLRADTLGTMKRLYSALAIPVEEQELERVVHKHAWENIPEEQKGPGKFLRRASPGSWREDLTPVQVEIVERVTAPLLKELYPD